jgi:hypothetical protein
VSCFPDEYGVTQIFDNPRFLSMVPMPSLAISFKEILPIAGYYLHYRPCPLLRV